MTLLQVESIGTASRVAPGVVLHMVSAGQMSAVSYLPLLYDHCFMESADLKVSSGTSSVEQRLNTAPFMQIYDTQYSTHADM